MNSPQFDRVSDDLNMMRALTGADLPFERVDARMARTIGCLALLPAAAGAAGLQSRWLLLAIAAPFVISVGIWLVRSFRAARADKPCPHEKRREARAGIPIMLACLLLLAGFRVWASAAGAPSDVVNGCVLFFLGLLLILNGLAGSGHRSAILPGAAAVLGGFLWPYCDYFLLWTLVWSFTGVAMVGSSFVMERQLVAREQ